jgi:hypothetical protein
MSHLFMEDWIFGYRDGTGVIAHERNSLKAHSKISHGVQYSKNLQAAASNSYILDHGSGLCNRRLYEKTNKQEKISENDKYQKCSFGQSHNPQNQHQKSQQDQAK